MFIRRMTENQKNLAKSLEKSGFSRRDSKIYAQNTSDFMFQTGVAYTSGVLTAATVGVARMVGHGVGWCVGKAVHGVGSAIEKKKMEQSSPDAIASREERKAKKAAEKIRRKAVADFKEVEESAAATAENQENGSDQSK